MYMGYEKIPICDQCIALTRKDIKYDHSDNGRRIGSRIQPIKWSHFQ